MMTRKRKELPRPKLVPKEMYHYPSNSLPFFSRKSQQPPSAFMDPTSRVTKENSWQEDKLNSMFDHTIIPSSYH